MAITDAWTAPTDNEIDLDNGDVIGEATFDKMGSDLLWLYNRRPRTLAKGTGSVNQDITANTTPGTDITGLTSGSITPDGTRDVKITVELPDCVNAGGGAKFCIQKDGVVVANKYLNTNQVGLSWVYIDAAPTNAAHTYKVSAFVTAGTLKTNNADVTNVTNLILVEHINLAA